MVPIDNHDRPPLHPPRFRLRTLLLAVTLCCVFLGVVILLDPFGKFAMTLLVLTVAAHFVGATLGHRLQAHGSRKTAGWRNPRAPNRTVQPAEFAPTPRLGRRQAVGRLILIMTVSWGVLGAASGAALLLVVNGERSTVVNVCSGAAAFAVLGSIWGFALAAFAKEVWCAVWEARK